MRRHIRISTRWRANGTHLHHRTPQSDTDSIIAAISYAMLKNALGERAYTAARIGELSDQTQMVLKKFDLPPRRFCITSARRCPI
jgi:inorganic pyrophosphatase/exopolyphosphatase